MKGQILFPLSSCFKNKAHFYFHLQSPLPLPPLPLAPSPVHTVKSSSKVTKAD